MTDEERARSAAIVSDTLALNEARRLGRQGALLAHDHQLVAALHRRYGNAKNMLLQLGFDEQSASEYIDSWKETDMPNYDRRRTPAGRRATDGRRARDMLGDMSPIDAIESLMSELEPEEQEELLDRLGSDRRRLGRDQPPPFPGRPNPGGGMDPLDNMGTTYRTERQAADRARRQGRHAHDAMPLGYREQREFDERFPSAKHIRTGF
jgi:hypothetical protein